MPRGRLPNEQLSGNPLTSHFCENYISTAENQESFHFRSSILLTQKGCVDDPDRDGETGVAAEDVVHVDQDEGADGDHQKDGEYHELGHDPRQHEPVGTLRTKSMFVEIRTLR